MNTLQEDAEEVRSSSFATIRNRSKGSGISPHPKVIRLDLDDVNQVVGLFLGDLAIDSDSFRKEELLRHLFDCLAHRDSSMEEIELLVMTYYQHTNDRLIDYEEDTMGQLLLAMGRSLYHNCLTLSVFDDAGKNSYVVTSVGDHSLTLVEKSHFYSELRTELTGASK